MNNSETMMRFGWLFLILFNLSHWFVHPTSRLWHDVADGGNGLALGLAIGCLLLGMRRRGGASCA